MNKNDLQITDKTGEIKTVSPVCVVMSSVLFILTDAGV